jgi:uncharacterized protein YlaI
MNYEAERRPAQRTAYCRSCDKKIHKGEDMISMYSFRNRGQYIHICLECAEKIGNLAKEQNETGKI